MGVTLPPAAQVGMGEIPLSFEGAPPHVSPPARATSVAGVSEATGHTNRRSSVGTRARGPHSRSHATPRADLTPHNGGDSLMRSILSALAVAALLALAVLPSAAHAAKRSTSQSDVCANRLCTKYDRGTPSCWNR